MKKTHTNSRSNTRETLTDKIAKIRRTVPALKYATVITIMAIFLASCGHKEHTPEYKKAKMHQVGAEIDEENADARLDDADEKVKDVEEYEDAIDKVKEETEELQEAQDDLEKKQNKVRHNNGDDNKTPQKKKGRDRFN